MAYSRNPRQHRRPRPSSKTRFWYIGKRNKNNELVGLLVAAMLILGGAWNSLSKPSRGLLVALLIFLILLLFGLVIGFAAFMAHRQRQKLRALTAAQVDAMDGLQFERYVAALLSRQGYSHVRVTQSSGDYGVDIIATKQGQKWAVQAKHYTGSVGIEAIQQAFSGCNYYHCQRSMVVTTSRFTTAAKTLAASHNTALIDRDTLAEWILTFQQVSTNS